MTWTPVRRTVAGITLEEMTEPLSFYIMTLESFGDDADATPVTRNSNATYGQVSRASDSSYSAVSRAAGTWGEVERG